METIKCCYKKLKKKLKVKHSVFIRRIRWYNNVKMLSKEMYRFSAIPIKSLMIKKIYIYINPS